ncbi:MAG: HU family DNA-binding protein [Candidatus Babeliales bacterium]
MNKAKLVEQMAKITKLPKATCKSCLEAFILTVRSSLKKGMKIGLTGFGTFTVMKRKARDGVNPATGKKMRIPAKKVAKFTAGKDLREQVGG